MHSSRGLVDIDPSVSRGCEIRRCAGGCCSDGVKSRSARYADRSLRSAGSCSSILRLKAIGPRSVAAKGDRAVTSQVRREG